MIDRFHLKEYLSFKELSLEFSENLIIFSGASGAGKSILMEALLSLFGLKDSNAKVLEASISKKIDFLNSGIENDDPNIFRVNRDKSTRYFINNQQISKKNIKGISSNFIKYLSLREFDEFENEKLLTLLDSICLKENSSYQKILDKFKSDFQNLKNSLKELTEIEEKEREIIDLKEFAEFEISKIKEIDPKPDEYEELLSAKKELSKKEKIENAIKNANKIFEFESDVWEVLNLLELDGSSFDESMNELKVIFENATSRMDELSELDIESILTRLENLSYLKKKYGSIEESLEFLKKRELELQSYENIEFEKTKLLSDIKELQTEVQKSADELHQNRKKALLVLNSRVEYYLNLLYLEKVELKLTKIDLHDLGYDEINVSLNGVELNKISSGELNRLRLAFLASSSEFIKTDGGVLILDEIDANLSGKESMSIAKVLLKLSQNYQIFAISHQPQLSSKAKMHFLVYKENNISKVKLLSKDERLKELSRMISGDKISDEALNFAKSLMA